MAIAFRGSASATAVNGGDPSITLSGISGLAQNDLVIVAYSIADNDNVDENMAMITSGYTEVADLFSNDTVDANLGVFYKFMGVSPDTTATCDGLGGTDAGVAAVAMAFSGVATVAQGGPFDVTSTTATGLSTAHPNPPSISTFTEATSWVVIAGGAADSAFSAIPDTITYPTGYTTNPVSAFANDDTNAIVGMGYKSSPADPEDPGTMTLSGSLWSDSTDNAWCAVTMALKVATSGGALTSVCIIGI